MNPRVLFDIFKTNNRLFAVRSLNDHILSKWNRIWLCGEINCQSNVVAKWIRNKKSPGSHQPIISSANVFWLFQVCLQVGLFFELFLIMRQSVSLVFEFWCPVALLSKFTPHAYIMLSRPTCERALTLRPHIFQSNLYCYSCLRSGSCRRIVYLSTAAKTAVLLLVGATTTVCPRAYIHNST